MLRYSLCALAGAYALQVFTVLPPAGVAIALVVPGLVCAGIRRCRPVAAFVAGGLVMWCAASTHLADRLNPAAQGETLTITAQVLDFPSRKNGTLRFLVRPLEPAGLPARVRLSWFDPAFLQADEATRQIPGLGQVWQFQVRLKRPRGFANPGGFDRYDPLVNRNPFLLPPKTVATPPQQPAAASDCPRVHRKRLRAARQPRVEGRETAYELNRSEMQSSSNENLPRTAMSSGRCWWWRWRRGPCWACV